MIYFQDENIIVKTMSEADPYSDCINDDNLNLYFYKKLK